MVFLASEMSSRGEIQRVDFGRVSVFFGDKNGKYPDGNQVIVRGSEIQTAFDTPIVSNFIGSEFDTVELVILGHVHEDHMAGLHRLPNVPVYAHEADLPAAHGWNGMLAAYGISDRASAQEMLSSFQRDFYYAPRPDARGYSDGASWNLGQVEVTAFHMPGHTAGHCVLLIEPEGVAFIGDIDLTGFGPYYGDASSSLADFRRSLVRLPDVPAKVWVTAHHRGVYTDRIHFLNDLAAYAAKINDREERLLQLLSDSPKTLRELVAARLLYPPHYDSPWVTTSERHTILQHLDELLHADRVLVDERGIYRRT